jgi:hypothetical protein
MPIGDPPPQTGPCGGTNEPPCPPEPAIIKLASGQMLAYFTLDEMKAHGQACYAKGGSDASALDRDEGEKQADEILSLRKKLGDEGK